MFFGVLFAGCLAADSLLIAAILVLPPSIWWWAALLLCVFVRLSVRCWQRLNDALSRLTYKPEKQNRP